MRLLVVEDSPLLRKMFGLAFPNQTNDLEPAENGRSAMALLAASGEPFDAVQKPWSPLALRSAVHQVIESARG